jgi:hypothetical protein
VTSAFGGQRSIQLSYGCIAPIRLQSDSSAAIAGQCLRNTANGRRLPCLGAVALGV